MLVVVLVRKDMSVIEHLDARILHHRPERHCDSFIVHNIESEMRTSRSSKTHTMVPNRRLRMFSQIRHIQHISERHFTQQNIRISIVERSIVEALLQRISEIDSISKQTASLRCIGWLDLESTLHYGYQVLRRSPVPQQPMVMDFVKYFVLRALLHLAGGRAFGIMLDFKDIHH